MGRSGDVLRSLVWRAAERARTTLQQEPRWQGLQRRVGNLLQKRIVIADRQLGPVLAAAEGVAGLTVACRDGRVCIDADLASGGTLTFAIGVEGHQFAPRGAKELSLRVYPSELSNEPTVRSVVSLLCGVIAHAIWQLVLPVSQNVQRGAFVEREQDGRLTADLRSVPEVRQLQARGLAAVVDAIELGSVDANDGALTVRWRLPTAVRAAWR